MNVIRCAVEGIPSAASAAASDLGALREVLIQALVDALIADYEQELNAKDNLKESAA
jgi:hypothetical protein